jgi:PKD repeat protein
MKTIFTIRKLFFFLSVVAIGGIACKKTETVTITIKQPTAAFSVNVNDPFLGYPTLRAVNYIDSNFYFRNGSDTGKNMSYSWDFGDGTTSIDRDPKHSYGKRGSYAVKLTVSNDDKAFDTVEQTVSVILGQQFISFGDGIDLSPVAIEETSASEFVLLGSGDYGTNYHLFQLDSLLKQKNKKTFPDNYRLISMKATSDGNYIFTGSTQANNKANELIKMKADGTELWNKTLSTDDSYSYAAQTPDGGFMVIGSRAVLTGSTTNYNTVVIKTDGNGNQQWQKLLDAEGMAFTNNAVIEQDGVVAAGIKRGNCSECDSILVVKLDNTGNVVWKNTVIGGMNNFVWWDTYIAKLINGNYAVSNGYTRGIFFFSPPGGFLDRKIADYQVASVASSGDGNLIVLQTELNNGFRMNIAKFTLDGARQWYAYPDGRQKNSGGYSCCSDSRPVAMQRLRNGGILVTGNSVVYNSTNNNKHMIMVLLELDEAGKPK